MDRIRHPLGCLLAALWFYPTFVFGQDLVGTGFEACKARLDGILSGNMTWNGINNETIQDPQYQYFGPVRGMNPDYERQFRRNFTTLTTHGKFSCKVICGDPLDWYWQSDVTLTLGIISNWILPILALLAALPYDSLHGRIGGEGIHQSRVLKTLGALNNWIGSPQTAMTATLFNIHQMRKCLRETVAFGSGTVSGTETYSSEKMNAYYVLGCIGQFRLPGLDNLEFLEPLTYGLFRPMVAMDQGEPATGNAEAQQWTRQLLEEMAFQLKMLRRRGVYPAFLSIFLFCVAYSVSVVLAFALDVGERTTAHAMAFGILLSWLPLLVLFAIIDRNPVSADRSRKLIARWLWNADAVRRWELSQARQSPLPRPEWWSQRRENAAPRDRANQQQVVPFDDFIGEFSGQGRQIGYHGLAYAVIQSAYDRPGVGRRMRSTRDIAAEALVNIRKRRPAPWRTFAFTSLAIVWLEIGMAIMISYNTPTVGLACRSGSYIMYGILSSLTWFLQLPPCFKRPGLKRKALCHALNLLAVLALMMIIFAAFSGVFNNCTCKGGFSGYMDFENSEFYRDKAHFDVSNWWITSAVVGALPMIFSLSCIAVIPPRLLPNLKPLWKANEHRNRPEDMDADTMWLI